MTGRPGLALAVQEPDPQAMASATADKMSTTLRAASGPRDVRSAMSHLTNHTSPCPIGGCGYRLLRRPECPPRPPSRSGRGLWQHGCGAPPRGAHTALSEAGPRQPAVTKLMPDSALGR